jgi:citrate lyase subunit beta/citryl-CoA lyase/(S)-citramalyl-CoA lyase
MPVRSWLCAPALNSKLVAKALEVAADVVLFDLEDSVPSTGKEAARQALLTHFKNSPQIATAVRVNSLCTCAGLKDLLFLIEHAIAPDILLLPKAMLPGDINVATALFKERNMGSIQVFAIIETVDSLWTLRTLHAAPSGLRGLIFGAADFAADMGVQPTCADLRFARQEIALAARRFGVAAIDSPCFQLLDEARLDCETCAARDLGFVGKIAIHPRQVSRINQLFTPSAQALDNARKLVAASEQQPEHSILRVDDGMVGPPFLKYARQVLSGRPRG